MAFDLILYILLMLYICRSLVWKLGWPGFWWIFCKAHHLCIHFLEHPKIFPILTPLRKKKKKKREKKHHNLRWEKNSAVIKGKKKPALTVQVYIKQRSYPADINEYNRRFESVKTFLTCHTRDCSIRRTRESFFFFRVFFFFFFFFASHKHTQSFLPASASLYL